MYRNYFTNGLQCVIVKETEEISFQMKNTKENGGVIYWHTNNRMAEEIKCEVKKCI